MLNRKLKTVLTVLLMAGCAFIANAGTSPRNAGTPAPQGKFRVVVLTPGTGRTQTVRDQQQSAAGTLSGVQPLPNYRGETLTLGLLSGQSGKLS